MLTVKEGERSPTYKIVKDEFILFLISQATLSMIFITINRTITSINMIIMLRLLEIQSHISKRKKKKQTQIAG